MPSELASVATRSVGTQPLSHSEGLSPKKQRRRAGPAKRCDMDPDPAEMVMMTATTIALRVKPGSARPSPTGS
jgi:hypothetical protein